MAANAGTTTGEIKTKADEIKVKAEHVHGFTAYNTTDSKENSKVINFHFDSKIANELDGIFYRNKKLAVELRKQFEAFKTERAILKVNDVELKEKNEAEKKSKLDVKKRSKKAAITEQPSDLDFDPGLQDIYDRFEELKPYALERYPALKAMITDLIFDEAENEFVERNMVIKNIDPNRKKRAGVGPLEKFLFVAIRRRDLDCIHELIEMNVNVNVIADFQKEVQGNPTQHFRATPLYYVLHTLNNSLKTLSNSKEKSEHEVLLYSLFSMILTLIEAKSPIHPFDDYSELRTKAHNFFMNANTLEGTDHSGMLFNETLLGQYKPNDPAPGINNNIIATAQSTTFVHRLIELGVQFEVIHPIIDYFMPFILPNVRIEHKYTPLAFAFRAVCFPKNEMEICNGYLVIKSLLTSRRHNYFLLTDHYDPYYCGAKGPKEIQEFSFFDFMISYRNELPTKNITPLARELYNRIFNMVFEDMSRWALRKIPEVPGRDILEPEQGVDEVFNWQATTLAPRKVKPLVSTFTHQMELNLPFPRKALTSNWKNNRNVLTEGGKYLVKQEYLLGSLFAAIYHRFPAPAPVRKMIRDYHDPIDLKFFRHAYEYFMLTVKIGEGMQFLENCTIDELYDILQSTQVADDSVVQLIEHVQTARNYRTKNYGVESEIAVQSSSCQFNIVNNSTIFLDELVEEDRDQKTLVEKTNLADNETFIPDLAGLVYDEAVADDAGLISSLDTSNTAKAKPTNSMTSMSDAANLVSKVDFVADKKSKGMLFYQYRATTTEPSSAPSKETQIVLYTEVQNIEAGELSKRTVVQIMEDKKKPLPTMFLYQLYTESEYRVLMAPRAECAKVFNKALRNEPILLNNRPAKASLLSAKSSKETTKNPNKVGGFSILHSY